MWDFELNIPALDYLESQGDLALMGYRGFDPTY